MQTKIVLGKVVRERYVVEALLGQGGFGAVYRVRDRRVRSNVFALKEVVQPSKHQRDGFVFEGEVLRRLDHPSLPRVYRVFEDEKSDRLYMLMDYIEGPNLERLRLQQPGRRFSVSEAMSVMRPVMEAVIYLHAQRPPILHRDIKPANIIVPRSGANAVLVDFGIAKEYNRDSTTTAVRHCSPGYGAPEQYVYGTNPQTDMYGLAATLYTLLTGEIPVDALYRITRLSGRGNDPLVPAKELVPTLPTGISDALERALAVNSNDRFATVEEFRDTLLCYVEEAEGEETVAELTVVEDEREGVGRNELLLARAPETPALPLAMQRVEQGWRGKGGGKRGGVMVFVCLIVVALIALGSGLTLGVGVWHTGHRHMSISGGTKLNVKQRSRHTGVATALAPTVEATATPTVGVTLTPTPTAAPSVPTVPSDEGSYPKIGFAYSGSIHNTPANVDASMSISRVQQDESVIRGYFAVGPGLIGSGNFTGVVTGKNGISFLVSSGGNILPLFFQGRIFADGSMSGTYCSYQNGQCDYAGGGYGNWHVSPW